MSIRSVAIAVLAVFAFSLPALSQSGTMMKDNGAMMMSPTGQMMMTEKMDASMMEMAMKNAKPVEAGTLFFMSGGKMYMLQDMKMENGKMMSDQMMMK